MCPLGYRGQFEYTIQHRHFRGGEAAFPPRPEGRSLHAATLMNTTPSSTPHSTSTATSDGIAGRALVFGGGGSAGNAWEIGVIAGLLDAGLDVTEADLIIGTSAGATAPAQITGAPPLTELFAGIVGVAGPRPSGPVAAAGGRGPLGPVADHME